MCAIAETKAIKYRLFCAWRTPKILLTYMQIIAKIIISSIFNISVLFLLHFLLYVLRQVFWPLITWNWCVCMCATVILNLYRFNINPKISKNPLFRTIVIGTKKGALEMRLCCFIEPLMIPTTCISMLQTGNIQTVIGSIFFSLQLNEISVKSEREWASEILTRKKKSHCTHHSVHRVYKLYNKANVLMADITNISVRFT